MKVLLIVLVGLCATPEPARSAPMRSTAQADADTVLEGTMEVLIEDSDQGSRTLYFLISGDRRVPVRFLRRPRNLTTGTRVRLMCTSARPPK